MQKYMGVKYEPASEPMHISIKQLFFIFQVHCRAGRDLLKWFETRPLWKWLEPRPKSGLDWLVISANPSERARKLTLEEDWRSTRASSRVRLHVLRAQLPLGLILTVPELPVSRPIVISQNVLINSFRKSTPPQHRQLVVDFYELK